MSRNLCATGMLAACLFIQLPFAQSEERRVSLCILQKEVTEGKHVTAQVAGVYSLGLDSGTLPHNPGPTFSASIDAPAGPACFRSRGPGAGCSARAISGWVRRDY